MTGKVLFIDDQKDFLELLKIRLRSEEYEKHFLTDADEAEEYVKNNHIDVVVSDMNMPKNGIELFRALRKSAPHVVRVALSGSLNTHTLLMAINEGDVYKYITKPWKVDEEGKKIIKNAINYSMLLKKEPGEDERSEYIHVDKVRDLLEKLNLQYEICEKTSENQGDSIDLNLKYLLKIRE